LRPRRAKLDPGVTDGFPYLVERSRCDDSCARITDPVRNLAGRSALLWAAKHAWLVGARLEVTGPAPESDGVEEVRRAFPSLPVSVRQRANLAAALIDSGHTSDLLVLGCHDSRTHGLGPSPTVAAVAAHADCDVVVVGGKPHAILGRHDRIAVLLSPSTMERAVHGAVMLAQPRHAAVHLVLTIPPISVSRVAAATAVAGPVLDEAAAMMRRLSPMIRVSTELLSAKPHEAVVRLTDSDVLVVGADGPLDALARAALHHARCPILVAHQDQLVDPESE
jgi:nucleotide-binding universal stress UspA family protein